MVSMYSSNTVNVTIVMKRKDPKWDSNLFFTFYGGIYMTKPKLIYLHMTGVKFGIDVQDRWNISHFVLEWVDKTYCLTN